MKFINLDKIYTVELEKEKNTYQIIIDDNKRYIIEDVLTQPDVISFKLNNKIQNVCIISDKDKIYLAIDGETYTLEFEKDISTKSKYGKQQKGNSVSSPMPGLLVKVPVSVGDQVKSGTTLAIVEAMKMQNELPSPRDGIVKKINRKEGEQVDALQVIVELEQKL